jgi:hypothetical protein
MKTVLAKLQLLPTTKGGRSTPRVPARNNANVLHYFSITIGKPIGDPPHRTAQHGAATSTSDSWSGYGHPVLWQYAAMNRTGTTRRWRESSVPATACSGPTACGRDRGRYADSRYTNSVCVLAGNGMCPKGRRRGSGNGALERAILPVQRMDGGLALFGTAELVEI